MELGGFGRKWDNLGDLADLWFLAGKFSWRRCGFVWLFFVAEWKVFRGLSLLVGICCSSSHYWPKGPQKQQVKRLLFTFFLLEFKNNGARHFSHFVSLIVASLMFSNGTLKVASRHVGTRTFFILEFPLSTGTDGGYLYIGDEIVGFKLTLRLYLPAVPNSQ